MADMATASAGVVDPTGNDFIDTLVLDLKWNDDHPVTFYFDDGTLPSDEWLDAAKDALRNALDIYEEYIALQFEEVDAPGDANFILRMNTMEEIEATARFEYPDPTDDQSVGQFPLDWSRWTPWHLQVGGYAFATVLHEVGHGLGLGHPFGSGGLNGQPFPGVVEAIDLGHDGQNNGIYTIMSYRDHSQFWAPDPPTSDLGWGYAGSPMGLDIAALQHVYGANPTANAGHDTYTLPAVEGDGTYWRAIWDTGGTDIIRHSGPAAANIDLRAAPLTGPDAGGYLSRVQDVAGGFTIAHGVTIEFAEGGDGNDTITGNAAGNEIAGRGGHDTINGFGGDDLIEGGAGDDWMNGGAGRDTLSGGLGNDTYLVDSLHDSLHEGAGGGIDTVITTVTRTLGDHFENLHLAQSATVINGFGNALANQIIGNGDANRLEGRDGNDFVNGAAGRDSIDGGSGNDTLLGGEGDDVLDGGGGGIVIEEEAAASSRGDVPRPDPDRGIDDFRIDDVRIDDRAPPPAGADDLLYGGKGNDTLYGRGGDDRLLGDAGEDRLFGGSGDDWLDGGTGGDMMAGEGGHDIYVVDSKADIVQEAADQGIDGVFSLIDYTLGAHVENLALLGGATHHIAGTGNGLANWIVGNDGSNVIDGRAGGDLLVGMGGNDFLDGGTGTDTIFGGDGDDVVDGGDDAVLQNGPAFAAFPAGFADSLHGGNGDDIVYGRGGNDALHGDAGDDELYGGTGADTLSGDAGDDTLTGGAGGDRFVFSGAFGDDLVVDFNRGQGDRLAISGYGKGLDSFAELAAHVADNGIDTTIDLAAFGGGTILLAGFTGLQAADLDLLA